MQGLKRLISGDINNKLYLSTRLYAAAVPAASSAATPDSVLKAAEVEMKKNLEKTNLVIGTFQKDMSSKAKLWNEQYEIYYGKDRDTTNFPMLKINEYHPKVRLGFLPDSWFQAFYDKTGVTGPYLFLVGTTTFLLSKELWVMDHEFFEILPIVAVYFGVTKLYGAKIASFFDKQNDDRYKKLTDACIDDSANTAKDFISKAKVLIENEPAQMQLFQAKREIVNMQLEAAYRERLVAFHKAVKSRLDYQVEREVSRRKMQQEYMVSWIVDNVVKNITPQLEKAMLSQCIKDLQGLAPK